MIGRMCSISESLARVCTVGRKQSTYLECWQVNDDCLHQHFCQNIQQDEDDVWNWDGSCFNKQDPITPPCEQLQVSCISIVPQPPTPPPFSKDVLLSMLVVLVIGSLFINGMAFFEEHILIVYNVSNMYMLVL